jgi:hypothetical protein
VSVSLTDAAARGVSHDGVPTTFPAGSVLEYRTGAPPGANAAPTGTLLNSITLPATPWAVAASRGTPKSGTWSATAAASGMAGHFRLKTSGDTGASTQNEARIEGVITIAGSGTVSVTAGAATFSTSQAGVVANGYKVIVAGISYTVSAFDGTTGCTLSGSPTFGASAFTVSGGGDLTLDNPVIASGQTVTENSFSVNL